MYPIDGSLGGGLCQSRLPSSRSIGVFHQGHLVDNYGCFGEQCLQSCLGLVVISWLVMLDQQKRHTSDARDSTVLQPSSLQPEEPVHPLPRLTASPEVQQTWIVSGSACNLTLQYSLQLQAPVQFPSIQQSTSRS